MKSKLRYIIAIIIAFTIGSFCFPIVDFRVIEISVFDIIKMAIGEYGGSEPVREIASNIDGQMTVYTYGIVGLISLIILAFNLTLTLNEKVVYKISLGIQLVIQFVGIALYSSFAGKIQGLKSATVYLGSYIQLELMPILYWIILYLVSVLLCAYGIILVKNEEKSPEPSTGRTVQSSPVDRNAEKLRLEQLYAELGRSYYETGLTEPLPQFIPLLNRITQTRDRLDMKTREKVCPRCGNKLSIDASFCGRCGMKVM